MVILRRGLSQAVVCGTRGVHSMSQVLRAARPCCNAAAKSVATVRSALVPGLIPAAFNSASNFRRSACRAGDSPSRIRRRSRTPARRQSVRAAPRPNFRRTWLSGKPDRKARKVALTAHAPPPLAPARQGGGQPRQPDPEDIPIGAGVLAGDAVAPAGLGHGGQQRHPRRPAHVMAPAFPEPAGIGERDGGKHGRRILPPELGEHAPKPKAQIRHRRRPRPPPPAGRRAGECRDWYCSRWRAGCAAPPAGCARRPAGPDRSAPRRWPTALASKSATLMPWPSAKTWTLPGFSA